MLQRHRTHIWQAVLWAALAAVLLPSCLALGLASRQELAFDASARCISVNRIVDRDGLLLLNMSDQRTGLHDPVALDEIPVHLRQAVVATEDASFYSNVGIDIKGILRAAWLDARACKIVAGGSTITQQVARTLVLGRESVYERTWQRKVQEMVVALRLRSTFNKQEILSLYLNESYFGHLAYGAQAASQVFYGKPVAQLDLAECALLAGLLQAPAAYDPLLFPDAARQRQRTVLSLMVRQGYISIEEAELAAREPLRFALEAQAVAAPHACVLVQERLVDLVGAEVVAEGGLTVETTLSHELQAYAEDQVALQLALLNRDVLDGQGVDNAAVLALDARTGAIFAMVGSPDYGDERIDGAVNGCLTLRQPGSALKPVTYALAFERGYSPATVVADVRASYLTREGQPYVPVNYDYRYHGPVALRRALACSYNTVAVRLLDVIGIEAWVQGARRFGLDALDPDRYGLALTLGSGEVSLVDLCAAYAVLANAGRPAEPYLIERVLDGKGKVIYDHQPTLAKQVVDPRIAYLVTDILADDLARAPSFGEQSLLAMPFPAAVKTGTTTDWRDNWTLGYTSDMVVGVWVGNADNRPMRDISGVDGAAPIWHAVLAKGQAWLRQGVASDLTMPPGLVSVNVCAESGLLPGSACAHGRDELFLAENAPQQTCDVHRWVDVDLRTGSLAASGCPDALLGQARVTLWNPELLPWATEQGLVSGLEREVLGQRSGAPSATHGLHSKAAQPRVLRPDDGSRFVLAPDMPLAAQQIIVEVAANPAEGPVELLVDGDVYHTWHSPPYRLVWQLDTGQHVFRAMQPDLRKQDITGGTATIRVFAPDQESAETGLVGTSLVVERTGS